MIRPASPCAQMRDCGPRRVEEPVDVGPLRIGPILKTKLLDRTQSENSRPN